MDALSFTISYTFSPLVLSCFELFLIIVAIVNKSPAFAPRGIAQEDSSTSTYYKVSSLVKTTKDQFSRHTLRGEETTIEGDLLQSHTRIETKGEVLRHLTKKKKQNNKKKKQKKKKICPFCKDKSKSKIKSKRGPWMKSKSSKSLFNIHSSSCKV